MNKRTEIGDKLLQLGVELVTGKAEIVSDSVTCYTQDYIDHEVYVESGGEFLSCKLKFSEKLEPDVFQDKTKWVDTTDLQKQLAALTKEIQELRRAIVVQDEGKRAAKEDLELLQQI